MINSKQDLKFYINEDCKRNLQIGNLIKYYFALFAGVEEANAFRYLKCLRHLEYHLNNQGFWHNMASLFYKIKLNRLGLKYNIKIRPNTCGYGLRLLHLSGGGGILLNAEKIGNYCGFNAGTFIGNKGKESFRPTIGNYVSFGPGAKAFGNITIGDNVFIAANAVVTKNIESNRIAGGVPATIIKETKLETNEVYKKFPIMG